jgi:hypothetical protein
MSAALAGSGDAAGRFPLMDQTVNRRPSNIVGNRTPLFVLCSDDRRRPSPEMAIQPAAQSRQAAGVGEARGVTACPAARGRRRSIQYISSGNNHWAVFGVAYGEVESPQITAQKYGMRVFFQRSEGQDSRCGRDSGSSGNRRKAGDTLTTIHSANHGANSIRRAATDARCVSQRIALAARSNHHARGFHFRGSIKPALRSASNVPRPPPIKRPSHSKGLGLGPTPGHHKRRSVPSPGVVSSMGCQSADMAAFPCLGTIARRPA